MSLACRLFVACVILIPPTLMPLPALARGYPLVICHVGGPGNTEQAKPVLEKFLRHVEQAAGIPKGSMSGQYHTTRDGCLEYIDKHRPLFGVFDLATFLQLRKPHTLEPLACMGSLRSQRYHLLVREGTVTTLQALKGKKLISSHLQDPRFVSRIIFGGKLDAATHFGLVQTHRPLKGIRKVARAEAAATLVDDMAHAHLAELKLPVKLVSIYTSSPLPGLTLTTVGPHKDPATRKIIGKLVKALPGLCTGPGKSLCQTFQVSSFTRVKPNSYASLVKAYD